MPLRVVPEVALMYVMPLRVVPEVTLMYLMPLRVVPEVARGTNVFNVTPCSSRSGTN